MAAERVGKATQNKQMTHEVILSFNHVSECVCVFDIIVCSRTVLFCVFQLVFVQSGRGGEERYVGCMRERGRGDSDTVREKFHSS